MNCFGISKKGEIQKKKGGGVARSPSRPPLLIDENPDYLKKNL